MGLLDAVKPDDLMAKRIAPAQACLDGLSKPIASSAVLLNVGVSGEAPPRALGRGDTAEP